MVNFNNQNQLTLEATIWLVCTGVAALSYFGKIDLGIFGLIGCGIFFLGILYIGAIIVAGIMDIVNG